MYSNRKIIYGLLFAAFFLLEALHLFPHFIPDSSPIAWMKPLGHYAPIALALLLLFIIRIGELQKEKLEESLDRGGDLISRITDESNHVSELGARLDSIASATQDLANQLRSSDALLHGKLFYFQRDYKAACEIFEEVYAANPSNAESNRWLGICLLRDKQPKRAIPLLEFAARGKGSDPDLWFAVGEAKFRSWDRTHFASAEEDIQKALRLGLRDRESAQVILAKMQLTRDRNAAKQTLRDALSRNPGSPPIATELSRILFDERDWKSVIEIADRGLLVNGRNWAMYPLRAEAHLRRQESGDMDRARADIDEAKRGNSRDFNVHRVEAEYSLARAKSSAAPAEARLILIEARNRIVKVQDLFKSSLKSRVLALRARLSLALGDSDDCVASADAAIKSTDTPTPNSHLLLCAALTQKRNWVHLSRAAQHMRETFPVPVIQAWSSIFMLLADLFSRQPLEDLQEILRQCETDLVLYSGFDPTARSEWTEISWELPTNDLSSDERQLALALCEFLFGRRRYDTFVETLRSARRGQRKGVDGVRSHT